MVANNVTSPPIGLHGIDLVPLQVSKGLAQYFARQSRHIWAAGSMRQCPSGLRQFADTQSTSPLKQRVQSSERPVPILMQFLVPGSAPAFICPHAVVIALTSLDMSTAASAALVQAFITPMPVPVEVPVPVPVEVEVVDAPPAPVLVAVVVPSEPPPPVVEVEEVFVSEPQAKSATDAVARKRRGSGERSMSDPFPEAHNARGAKGSRANGICPTTGRRARVPRIRGPRR